MPIILGTLFFAVIFLGIVALVAQSRFGNAGVCWLSLLTLLLFVLLGSPALALIAVVTLGLAIVCAIRRLKPTGVIVATTATIAVVFFLLIRIPQKELQDRRELREKYPLVSIAPRLAYEQKFVAEAQEPQDEIALSPEAQKNLNILENRSSPLSRGRAWTLASVHNRAADEFVRARGFGPVRMLHVNPKKVELPESQPIRLPERSEPAYDTGEEPLLPLAKFPAAQRKQAFVAMHRAGQEEFLDPDRMGFVKDLDHVAGFEPHQFQQLPKLRDRSRPRTEWQITRLELVSLLKHDTPVAYVSEHLPQMNELRDAPTRLLDAFERSALERLRADEDLVIDEATSQIRMLGSLRSGKDCTQCHAVKRGALLGAFSYELTPISPPPKKQSAGDARPQA